MTGPVRTIAVCSGKGGVGKTTVAVNLALRLAQRGARVLLLDADLGLANSDLLLGLRPGANLRDVYAGHCELEDAIATGPCGLRVLAGASGDHDMATLGELQLAGLVRACSELRVPVDHLVVDLPAGIGDAVVVLARAVAERIVVICDDPASLTDAYGLIKVLRTTRRVRRFRVLANRVRDQRHGRALFGRLAAVCERFLDVSLDYLGGVCEDRRVQEAAQRRSPLMVSFPGAPAACALDAVCARLRAAAGPSDDEGHVAFFAERAWAVGRECPA